MLSQTAARILYAVRVINMSKTVMIRYAIQRAKATVDVYRNVFSCHLKVIMWTGRLFSIYELETAT